MKETKYLPLSTPRVKGGKAAQPDKLIRISAPAELSKNLHAVLFLSFKEMARRLEVNVRTVRDYIEMLADLGIPVEAERGRGTNSLP